ncbi:hypothetical protein G7Y79_00001g003410 [Physcia stellaris]|nr:hypothetical protein G7Y79_00001g003410 [Physcia stellaris]
MALFIQKPDWWTPNIDNILDSHYEYDNAPFDIKGFKTEIAEYTTTYRSKNGKPWDPSLFDIDLVISILGTTTGSISEARSWVLSHQWTEKEPKRYRDLGMVCPCGREEDGRIYMRVENLNKSDKSGIGFPRAGCCGSEKVWVLNPMPKAYVIKNLYQHAVRLYGKMFMDLYSDRKEEILAEVMSNRKALVRQWLSCQRAVKQAETGVGKEDDPNELQKCKDELMAAKKELDDAGGVFLWDKAYEDMPKLQKDNFA